MCGLKIPSSPVPPNPLLLLSIGQCHANDDIDRAVKDKVNELTASGFTIEKGQQPETRDVLSKGKVPFD